MDIQIVSHTIVKDGKPFIEHVLRQALPHVNRAIVTVSEKSTDGTLEIIRDLEKEFPTKMRVLFENVKKPAELTQVRQDQLNRSYEDVIWFLDDDDYWPTEKIEEIKKIIKEDFDRPDIDAWSVTPYQLIDEESYDLSWTGKSFTKFFKLQEGVHYRHPWPRDLIYKGDSVLYWKKNKRVKRIPTRFFHLSYLKNKSFRNEEWAKKFGFKKGNRMDIPKEEQKYVWDIIEIFNNAF